VLYRRDVCKIVLQFLAHVESVSWFLMKEGQGMLFFAAVKTVARLCHGELLKAGINQS